MKGKDQNDFGSRPEDQHELAYSFLASLGRWWMGSKELEAEDRKAEGAIMAALLTVTPRQSNFTGRETCNQA